jgi:membrane protease YdiL (CAAX protease family)
MNSGPTTPRPPSIAHTVMILLPAFVILPLVGRFSGVDYDVIADTTSNVLRGVVPMVGLSLVWGLLMAWRSGWLKPIFAKQPPSAFPKFFWLIPACWFGLCLIRLVSSPWPSFDATYLIVLAFAMTLVGFNEELLFRGILTYGARGSGPWSEARTMLISALGFGLFHLPNLLVGQALGPTLIQVCYAFFMGIALTVSMRLSRSILLPVSMHALWDFSTFTAKAHPPGPVFSYASFALLLTTLILIFAAVIWCLGKKRQPVYP